MKERTKEIRKNFLKNKKGITLIALVVTIIVLLILAGVSLSLVSGSNGTINRAADAVDKTNEASDHEKRELAKAEAVMNMEGMKYQNVPIPAGFAPTRVEGEDSVDEGLVITDQDGNEFVWIPVDETSVKYEKKFGTNNYQANDINQIKGELLGTFPNNNVISTNTSTVTGMPEKNVVVSASGVGGFYVGRYEAGTTAKTAETTTTWGESDAKSRVVVKKGYQPVRQIYQTQALGIANNWKTILTLVI